jgi:glutamate-1-semialdehyde 2,1-aminomutase
MKPRTRPDTATAAARVERAYRQRTPASAAAFHQAGQVLPGGVSGAAKHYEPYPIFIASAAGAAVTDLDGRRYVDLLMGAGSCLLGHSHPHVTAAIGRQLERAATILAPTELERRYAERLRTHMPYLERLRFANTGSEAVRTALRVARAVTGRTRYAKFEGNFHGSDDYFLWSATAKRTSGHPSRPTPTADCAGLPDRLADDVLVLPYNDPAAAAALLASHGQELAAVFLEPVAFSTGGAVAADPDFARAVADATRHAGALLVFDEVVTCLRLGLAGAPAYLGVTPDLSCAGKAIGGGLPLSAFGGRAEVMDAALGPAAPARIFHSGTFTANPLSLAAGMAVLEVVESEPVIATLDELGGRLRRTLQQVCDAHHRGQITGVGSMFQLHLTDHPPSNRREVLAGDLELLRLVLLGMCANGVLWPPIHPGVLSYAHTSQDLDLVADTLAGVLEELAG